MTRSISSRPWPLWIHLLAFGLMIATPCIFVGALTAYRFAAAGQAETEDRTRGLARDLQRDIDRTIESMIAALQSLATSPSIDAGDWRAFDEQARAVVANRGLAIGLRDREGRHVVNTSVPPGSALPASTDPVLRKHDPTVFDEAKPAVTDLATGAATKRPVVLVEVPVQRDGKVLYALGMSVDPASLAPLLLDALPDGNWLASVADRSHRIIARTRDQAGMLGRTASRDFVEKVRSHSGSLYSTTLDGVHVFTSFETSPLSGWMSVVSVPASVLDAPTRRLWIALVAAIGAALATSAVLATWYAHRLNTDVFGLAEHAAQLDQPSIARPKPSHIAEIEAVHRVISGAQAERAQHIAILTDNARHQSVLLAELNHRVKNTLAVIQSVASRTISDSRTPQHIRTKLVGRIGSLARAYDALSDANWEDTDLSRLLAKVAAAEGLTITCEGTPVCLRPKAVVALAQTFHELATNAREHGHAPGAEEVSVAVTWSVADDEIDLVWAECGPAPGQMRPEGFGLTIIRLCVERQLGGDWSVDLSDGHWRFRATIPLRSELGENARLAREEVRA